MVTAMKASDVPLQKKKKKKECAYYISTIFKILQLWTYIT